MAKRLSPRFRGLFFVRNAISIGNFHESALFKFSKKIVLAFSFLKDYDNFHNVRC